MASKKYILDAITKEETFTDLTAEEIAEKTTQSEEAKIEHDKMLKSYKEKEDLKASAKAKLIAGEPLTEAEADTIVL